LAVVYVDIGEARKVYGSAAALSVLGYQTCVVRSIEKDNLSVKPSCMDVEIGIDLKTKRVPVKTIDVAKEVLGEKGLHVSPKHFLSILRPLDPTVLISDRHSWFVVKNAAKKLDVPLLLWVPSAYSIFKLFLYLSNRAFSRSLLTPIGFFYLTYIARHSDYVMTNDILTAKVMQGLWIRHMETVWPTYTRFVNEDAYAEFLPRTRYVRNGDHRFPNQYVLSLIAIDSKTVVSEAELRSLKFVKSVALAVPDIDFVVIGTSVEALRNRRDYAKVKNLKLIGLVYDDTHLSELYRNALCVLYPYRMPGFSNRLLEAFFYGKAVITTSLTNKYYGDFVPNRDVIFADNPHAAVEALKKISSYASYRRQLEDASRAYYIAHYSPEKHAKAVERSLGYAGFKTQG